MGANEDPGGGYIKDTDMESIRKMDSTIEGKALISSMKYLKKSNADFVNTLDQCQRTLSLLVKCKDSERIHAQTEKKLEELTKLNETRISEWLEVRGKLERMPNMAEGTKDGVIQSMEMLNKRAKTMEDDMTLTLGESDIQIERIKMEENQRPYRGDGGAGRLTAWAGNINLKPTEKMSLSSTTMEWGVFKQKFCAYTSNEQWQHQPSNRTVKDLLLTCLEPDLHDRVNKQMSNEATREENLQIIGEVIEGINPIINRRVTYYKETKQKGESDLTYAHRMMTLRSDCQMLDMPIDEHLAAHQLAQHSAELRDYINIKVDGNTFPTLDQIIQYAKELERNNKMETLLGGQESIKYAGGRGRGRGRGERTREEENKPGGLQDPNAPECWVCGRKGHMSRECRSKDKANCTTCKEKGHFYNACKYHKNKKLEGSYKDWQKNKGTTWKNNAAREISDDAQALADESESPGTTEEEQSRDNIEIAKIAMEHGGRDSEAYQRDHKQLL